MHSPALRGSHENPPHLSGTVLRAGYTRIWEPSICMGFLGAGEGPEGVAMGDRLTGGQPRPQRGEACFTQLRYPPDQRRAGRQRVTVLATYVYGGENKRRQRASSGKIIPEIVGPQ
jgi:hypothetical protein